jgi:hypothetical protein
MPACGSACHVYPRHVIQRMLDPPCSRYMASYDVASDICQALACPTHVESSFLE